MHLDNEHRIPVMLGKNSKKAYCNLVNKYKYLNKTTKVDNYLTKIFNRAFKELELQAQCVGATSKTSITLQMHEAIEKFYYEYGRPETLTAQVKSKLKIPLSTIEAIIGHSFNVRGRDAINKHKKEFMLNLDLSMIREGNNYFVVYGKFYDKDYLQISLKEWLEPVINRIHRLGELYFDEIQELFEFDKEKTNIFRKTCDDYNISFVVDNNRIKYVSNLGGAEL